MTMHGYGSFAKYYDQLTQNISYGERAAYFDSIIKQNMDSASVIADLACGTGSLSFELADLGYDVVGVELSEDMLSVAMQKKMERPDLPFTNPLFICQNLCELELYSPADAAVCALDSINHITDPESVRRMFRQVGEYVRPGGLFLFDVNTEYKHRCVLGNETFVYDTDEVYCVWQNTLKEDLLVEIDLDFFVYDEENDCYYRESESFAERAYSHDFLCGLLAESGFELVTVYGDDSFEPAGETTQRAIYVAKKTGKEN